jgi:predicted RecB family nuclease
MDNLPDTGMPLPVPDKGKLVTSQLFAAYLACPTKCYLLAIGEVAIGNDYIDWDERRNESYRLDGVQRLMAEDHRKFDVGLPNSKNWKHALWDFVLDVVVRTQNCEARLHAVERISVEGTNPPSQFIPIRFVPTNKLTRSDKLIAGFEALSLAKALGVKVDTAKIIHGSRGTTSKVTANTISRAVNKTIGQVAALLSTSSPPDLILNRHCPECGFQSRCRKKAIEKDDLSLLANLPTKERSRLNGKGILTVNQLAYTFRPRRRTKRLAARPEKYHHSLKALALREKKIHLVGDPQLQIKGTAIYLDVEGLPDRDFYYLVGFRLEGDQGVSHHSLWADTAADEERMWRSFLDILSAIDHPVLIHYGSFETTFLKRMCDRYGGPPEDSAVAKAISSSVNVLSVIFAQVYFPTYSNGLKEIAQFLGFEWGDPSSSGLQSITWRHDWEASGDPTVREKLIAYNADDCKALCLVARTLGQISQPQSDTGDATGSKSDIIRAESLGKNLTSKWGPFKSPLADLELINSAAHWDYQRDRVFVRSGTAKRRVDRRSRRRKGAKKVEKVVILSVPRICPKCSKQSPRKERLLTRNVHDLVFGRDSVKRRVVKYVAQSYRCRSCGNEYGLNKLRLHGRNWGWNIIAYFIYHIVGLGIPQLTVQHSMNRLFGSDLVRSSLNNLKIKASETYFDTKRKIFERIINGTLIHADETSANIKGHLAYVWVFTSLREVVYILAESREGELVKELLKGFNGVLVSDFYAAYDTIECAQQKCLIHLMRDLNDEILNNPFDEEAKTIALRFAALLKPIVDTIDLRGLKKHFLRRHLVEVERFYEFISKSEFKSDVASKLKQRFEKNRDKLFTFLYYDAVPWNNNNAEHAIKAFARLRDVLAGSCTKKGIDEYLTLLSVSETCKYRGIDFLDFLRSGETDFETR